MTNQSLVKYIKESLAEGFAADQIRQALRQAGWQENEIEEGFGSLSNIEEELAYQDQKESFFARHGKALISGLVILVLLPVLAYGGFWAYQKFRKPAANPPTQPSATVQGIKTQDAGQQTTTRDLQRVEDIRNLQAALDKYYLANKTYPSSLETLINQGLLLQIPADPKNQQPYLYNPFGNPPLHYSLSFFLESDIGTLKGGLHSVSSENQLPADTIRQQQALIKGKTLQTPPPGLSVTDLSKTPFYPKEEVTLEIFAPPTLQLQSVKLIMTDLDLLDTAPPFRFRFTAPDAPGRYLVKVFVFNNQGAGYPLTTALTVTDHP